MYIQRGHPQVVQYHIFLIGLIMSDHIARASPTQRHRQRVISKPKGRNCVSGGGGAVFIQIEDLFTSVTLNMAPSQRRIEDFFNNGPRNPPAKRPRRMTDFFAARSETLRDLLTRKDDESVTTAPPPLPPAQETVEISSCGSSEDEGEVPKSNMRTVWERGSRGVVLKAKRPFEPRPPPPSPPPVDKDKVQTRVRTGSLKRKFYSPTKAPEVKKSSVMPDGRVVALVKKDGKLYSFKEFEQMWDDVFEDFGCDVEEIEEGNMVTRGNNSLTASDTQGQSKAQYGRLLPKATDDLLSELQVCRHDVFVDIGHGIGNTVLQAAYTRGCEAHGIEVMPGRNEIALLIQDNLESQRQIHLERDERRTEVGKVMLQRGRLEVDEHREFLTNPGRVTKAFLDNFNGVFSHRSLKARQVLTLDQYNAGIFCLMEPGSVLVTLWPLDLGATLGGANELRKRHGFSTSQKASFYTMEKFSFGEAREVVTWSQGGGCKEEMIGYKYTRIDQNTPHAVFQCCNANCEVAKAGTCIPAFKYINSPDDEDGRRVILNSCVCKYTPATKRSRRPKQHYYEG